MPQNLFSIRQFQLTKWSFSVHSTMRNAPYICPSHDSILDLWRTFRNVAVGDCVIFWPYIVLTDLLKYNKTDI